MIKTDVGQQSILRAWHCFVFFKLLLLFFLISECSKLLSTYLGFFVKKMLPFSFKTQAKGTMFFLLNSYVKKVSNLFLLCL